MTDDERSVTAAEWLEQLRAAVTTSRDLTLSAEEEQELLDLARIAAHRSERIAAPLTTFLVGIALADLPSEQRAGRISEVKQRMARAKV